MKAPLSLTLLPTGMVILSFEDAESRDGVFAGLQRTVPREAHSTFRSGTDGATFTLGFRPQHIAKPVVIPFNVDDDDASLAAALAPAEIPTGTPTTAKLLAMDRDKVPGPSAEAHTEEKPTSSGLNLTGGVPGAINNDPATAMNAGIEGSPGQAIKSALDTGLNRATPGGFTGPDKAAKVQGAASGTVPALNAETFHPSGQKQDAGVVNVNRAPDALGVPEKREEPKVKPLPPAGQGGKPVPQKPQEKPEGQKSAPAPAAPAPAATLGTPVAPAPATSGAPDPAPVAQEAAKGPDSEKSAGKPALAENAP